VTLRFARLLRDRVVVPLMSRASMQRRVWENLHAELGNRWALVMPGRMVSHECAAVVARRLGDDAMTTLVAGHDSDGEIMLVRPDAHLGWRGRADPEALDRWLTAVARQGRVG
jgi:4,5-epoxidase